MAPTHALHGALVLLLAGVLTWAGAAKLSTASEDTAFRRALGVLAPEPLRPALRYGVPVVELTLAVLLLAGFWAEVVAGAVVALFTAFVGVQVVLSRRGYAGGCGCFGDDRQGGEMPRTVALLGVAAAATVLADPEAPSVLAGGTDLLGQLTVVLGVVLTWQLARAGRRMGVGA